MSFLFFCTLVIGLKKKKTGTLVENVLFKHIQTQSQVMRSDKEEARGTSGERI